jgi:hypothetical protein
MATRRPDENGRTDKYNLPTSLVNAPLARVVRHRHRHSHKGYAAGSTSPVHPTDNTRHSHDEHPHSIAEWDNSHFHCHTRGGAYPENVELLD